MEILYRRYGSNGLEQKTKEFMSFDQGSDDDDDGDNSISFSEYLEGIRKTEDKNYPCFVFSQGLILGTADENKRLIQSITPVVPPPKKRPGSPKGERRLPSLGSPPR